MNIGDRVRFITDTTEGVVDRILPNGIIEVMIEDGFSIPALKSDLALVHNHEQEVFEGSYSKEEKVKNPYSSNTPKILVDKGVYFGFEKKDDELLHAWLINNTDFDIPFVGHHIEDDSQTSCSNGILSAKKTVFVEELRFSKMNTWPKYRFDMIFSNRFSHSPKQPLSKEVKLKGSRFFKEERDIPVLNKKGFYIRLDQDAVEIDSKELLDKISERQGSTHEYIKDAEAEKIKSEVDLHMEKLWPNAPAMSNGDILQFQLSQFEKKLDDAIYHGLDEITFIHGVGSGKLSMEMHRILSKHQQIKFFKDAQKEKFGYGATLVRIK